MCETLLKASLLHPFVFVVAVARQQAGRQAGERAGGEGGMQKKKDKLTARRAVSKHSLSCNNHLVSFLARGMGRADQIGF